MSHVFSPATVLRSGLLLLVSAATLPAQTPATPAPSTSVLPPLDPAAVTRSPTAHELAEARSAYDDGARALEHNNLERAQSEFTHAVQLDPADTSYRIGQQLALEHRATALVQQAAAARLSGNTRQADALQAAAEELDPSNRIVAQHVVPTVSAQLFAPVITADLESGQQDPSVAASSSIAGELRLAPAPGPRDLHVRADTRTVVAAVFSAWGIKAVFDDSVTPQDIRFDLDGARFAEAVPLALQMGRLFAVPLSDRSVLVAKDSADLRNRLEPQLQETIYVPGFNSEEMNQLGNMLRNIFDLRQIAVQNTSGRMLVRASSETVHAINRTLADLLDGTSEIVIDVRLYSVDRARTRTTGLQLPQQFGVYNVASAARSLVSSNQATVDQAIAQGAITLTGNAVTDLINEAVFLVGSGLAQSSLLTDTIGFFGKGLGLTGVTAGGASFSLGLSSSEVRALDNAQLRVLDHQSITFRAGTRYPITTSTYSTGLGASSASALAGVNINGVSASSLLNQFLGSTASATIPQISYEDLGLTLVATPVAQKSGNINMKLDLKIEALAGSALNNIPVLANRQFVSNITVEDGETALMASTLSKQESAAVSGIPGLGELPGFQSALADRVAQKDSTELVVLVTPHVVRRRSNATAGPRIAFSPSPDQRE